MAGVDIRNFTRREKPRFPYAEVAGAVLPGWDLSLVFAGSARAKKLNEKLRGKSYVPNVLSYAAGEKSGEVIICLDEAKKQAPAHEMSERDFILYLFIHGLLHLKGMAHGATMERCERKFLTRFSAATPHVAPHSSRDRHRDVPGKDGRRRRVR